MADNPDFISRTFLYSLTIWICIQQAEILFAVFTSIPTCTKLNESKDSCGQRSCFILYLIHYPSTDATPLWTRCWNCGESTFVPPWHIALRVGRITLESNGQSIAGTCHFINPTLTTNVCQVPEVRVSAEGPEEPVVLAIGRCLHIEIITLQRDLRHPRRIYRVGTVQIVRIVPRVIFRVEINKLIDIAERVSIAATSSGLPCLRSKSRPICQNSRLI